MDISLQRDGLILRGRLEGTNKLSNDTVVIMFHGFQGNLGYHPGKLIYDLSATLNDAGLPTLRFDFAGCGQSDGKFSDMTVFGEILDALSIIDFARSKMHAHHIYLVGHSQGGVVASMVAAYDHDLIDKLVLMAPAATLKDDALMGECQGTTYDPNRVPLTVSVHGIDVGGQYFRLAQLLPIYETAQHYEGPALIIHGLADQVVSPDASRKYNVIMPHSILHLLPGEGHDLEGRHLPQIKQLVMTFLKSSRNV